MPIQKTEEKRLHFDPVPRPTVEWRGGGVSVQLFRQCALLFNRQ